MTFGAFTTLEGRQFQIEKNHFLMLMFACCINSLKLSPLVVEKLLFDRKLVTAVVDIVKDLESFDHIPSNATVY